MMSSTAREKPKFLKDLPQPEDSFGSFENISNAIAEVIDSHDHVNSIALIGGWGSGKSTVVELLKDKYEAASDDPLVFEFDAWSHEGDPLRRAFIEKAVRFLRDPRGTGEEEDSLLDTNQVKYWVDRIEVLARRRSEETFSETPILSELGAFVTLAVILTPLVSALPLGECPWLHYFLWPILILTSYLLHVRYVRVRKEELERKRSVHPDDSKGDKDDERPCAIALTQEKQKKVVRTSAFSADPTSIEFQQDFNLLLDHLRQNSKRRLVVVIDNLDRLNIDDAVIVWNTMRSFFENDRDDKSGPVLLVPFDDKGVKGLWAQTGAAENQQKALASEFIDKTFQVRFQVPKPVILKYSTFVSECIAKAFPGTSQDECNDCYRVFQSVEGNRNPRRIKRLVNHMVSIELVRRSEFKLAHLALYASLTASIAWNVEDFLVPKYAEGKGPQMGWQSRIADVIGSSWRDYIAAIHFNVPVEDGLTVCLGPALSEALRTDSVNEIANSLRAIPGSSHVVEIVFAERKGPMPFGSQYEIVGFVEILESLGDLIGAPGQRVWKSLGEVLSRVSEWAKRDFDTGNAIGRILERSECELKAQDLASVMAVYCAKPSESEEDFEEGRPFWQGWYEGLHEILRRLSSDQKRAVEESVIFHGSYSNYRNLLGHCAYAMGGDTRDTFAMITLPEAGGSFLEQVVSDIAEGQWTEGYAASIDLYFSINEEVDSQPLISALCERLEATGDSKYDELETPYLLRTLGRFRDAEPDSDEFGFKELCDSGALFNHFQESLDFGSDYWPDFVKELVRYGDLKGAPDHKGQSQAGFNKLARLLSEPGQLLEIVNLSSKPSEEPWVRRIFDYGIESDDHNETEQIGKEIARAICKSGDESLGASDFIRWFWYFSECGESLATVWGSFADSSKLLAEIGELDGSDENDLEVMESLLSALPGNKKVVRAVLAVLGKLTKDVWLHQMEEDGTLLSVSALLVKSGSSIELDATFQNALEEFASGLFEQAKDAETVTPERWSRIWQLSSENQKANIRRSLLKKLKYTEEAFEFGIALFGDELLREISSQSDIETVALDLFTDIVKSGTPEALNWLSGVLQKLEGLSSAVSENLKNQIVARSKEDAGAPFFIPLNEMHQAITGNPLFPQDEGDEHSNNEE